MTSIGTNDGQCSQESFNQLTSALNEAQNYVNTFAGFTTAQLTDEKNMLDSKISDFLAQPGILDVTSLALSQDWETKSVGDGLLPVFASNSNINSVVISPHNGNESNKAMKFTVNSPSSTVSYDLGYDNLYDIG
jgi:hypothetical protein